MCILIVNFHETLNESSINIQRTMEKAIPFIREKENFCPHRRENLEKLFDCCESIIPPGHYPIFHSFMYPSIVLAIFLNEETVILLLSSTGIRILFQDNKKNFIGLRGFLLILSFVLGPFNRKDTRFFTSLKRWNGNDPLRGFDENLKNPHSPRWPKIMTRRAFV